MALEDVGGAGVAAPGILAPGPYDGAVAADRHAPAEAVEVLGVGGGEFLHLVQQRRLGALLAAAEAGRAGEQPNGDDDCECSQGYRESA